MKAAHTPGPWRVTKGTIIKQDLTCIGLDDDSGVLIGNACGYTNSGFFPSDEEGEANAHLMAAAPELLSELQALVANQEVTWRHAGFTEEQIKAMPYLKASRTAIEKATRSAT